MYLKDLIYYYYNIHTVEQFLKISFKFCNKRRASTIYIDAMYLAILSAFIKTDKLSLDLHVTNAIRRYCIRE